jgi:hypothetical protein
MNNNKQIKTFPIITPWRDVGGLKYGNRSYCRFSDKNPERTNGRTQNR